MRKEKKSILDRDDIDHTVKKVKGAIRKERVSFVSEFKKFITKGNVLDLAVAVVVGAAFGKITSGLVNDIITPLTGIFLGEIDLSGIKTVLRPEELNEAGEIIRNEIAIGWGSWLQTIIDFLIISLCVFIIVRVVKKAENAINAKELAEKAEKAKKEKEEADVKAAAEAEKLALEKKEKEEFYKNVREQTELLRQLTKK